MAESAKPGRNSLDPDKVNGFVKRIEDQELEITGIKDDAKQKCKDVKAVIENVYAEAQAAGINAKALKTALKQRKLEKAYTNMYIELDIDERSQLDQIRQALGDLADTPLGMASLGVHA